MQKQEIEPQHYLQTESNDEKQEKKQKLIRNEFKTAGKYGIPLIKKQKISLDRIELWSYTKIKSDDMGSV